MSRRDRTGRFSATTLAGAVYLLVTPAFVFGLYSPLLFGEANMFHYLNEAIFLWMALFLAPFAVIDRALAGWRSLRTVDARGPDG